MHMLGVDHAYLVIEHLGILNVSDTVVYVGLDLLELHLGIAALDALVAQLAVRRVQLGVHFNDTRTTPPPVAPPLPVAQQLPVTVPAGFTESVVDAFDRSPSAATTTNGDELYVGLHVDASQPTRQNADFAQIEDPAILEIGRPRRGR